MFSKPALLSLQLIPGLRPSAIHLSHSQACVLAMPPKPSNFNVDNVRVAKIVGSNVMNTSVVRGMCLTRPCMGAITDVKGAKVAIYGIPLDSVRLSVALVPAHPAGLTGPFHSLCALADRIPHWKARSMHPSPLSVRVGGLHPPLERHQATTETKGTVLLKSAEEIKEYNNSEEASLEKIIKAIADTGVNMIVCGQAVGELALHFLDKYKIMVLKVPSKFELRRVSRTTGANTLVRLEPPSPSDIGACERVHVMEIGSTMCTIFDHEEEGRCAEVFPQRF